MKRKLINNTAKEIASGDGLLTMSMQMIAMGTSSTIEHQEKVGQQQLANSREFPVRINSGCSLPIEDVLARMGITFLRKVDGDNLFCEVVLPQKWHLKPTDHSMWSKLVDDKERSRASIFYKAAFYDRDAFVNLEARFSIKSHFHMPDEEKYLAPVTKTVYEMVEEDFYDQRTSGFIGHYKRPRRRVAKQITERPRKYADDYEEYRHTKHYAEVLDGSTVVFSSTPAYFEKKYSADIHAEWWNEYEQFRELQTSLGELWLSKNYPNWKDVFAYWD